LKTGKGEYVNRGVWLDRKLTGLIGAAVVGALSIAVFVSTKIAK